MKMATKQITNTAYLVALSGTLGEVEVETLKRSLGDLLDQGGAEVVVDVSRVDQIDSELVRVLTRLADRLKAAGGCLLLASRDRASGGYAVVPLEAGRPDRLRGLHAGLDRAIG